MLPILAAAAAGLLFLRGKTRKNPGRRPHKRRRVLRNPVSVELSHIIEHALKLAKRGHWKAAYDHAGDALRLIAQRPTLAEYRGEVLELRNLLAARKLTPRWTNPSRKNPEDNYVLKNRIAHLRGLIREAPAEDKVKLREILKSEQLKLLKPRKNPLYPVVMPKPDEVSDMSVREMREFLAEHNINGDSFGNKRLRKEVRRVIHKSVRKNPRNKRKMSEAESRTVFGGYNAAREREAEATLRTPASEAARRAWNAAMLKRLRSNPKKKRRSTRKAKR